MQLRYAMKMFMVTVFLIGVTLIGYNLTYFAFVLTNGIDANVKIKNGYYLALSGTEMSGFIIKEKLGNMEMTEPILKGVDRFALEEEYIILKTRDGWAAIDSVTDEITCFFETLPELTQDLSLNESLILLKQGFPEFNILIYPRTWVMTFCLMVFCIVIFYGIFIALSRLFGKYRNQEISGSYSCVILFILSVFIPVLFILKISPLVSSLDLTMLIPYVFLVEFLSIYILIRILNKLGTIRHKKNEL
ncbi:hypothetical protein SMSP2_01084 [Limihaloglobus sulfuriphilus]|uniref:Uncharacterized protein n=1 Tax=Limihaloglobus sulfuriphilus TaxID=1851148 RepID=A0A1Q2MDE6_9BACT|nr:hypothetical protein [Limihaloglobus sulfuriphilus]AQQ70723.1 hypothetical protein SMSP2_01084 [Limihaloglobus sulfuriphilus]